jgi:hypothetical protein
LQVLEPTPNLSGRSGGRGKGTQQRTQSHFKFHYQVGPETFVQHTDSFAPPNTSVRPNPFRPRTIQKLFTACSGAFHGQPRKVQNSQGCGETRESNGINICGRSSCECVVRSVSTSASFKHPEPGSMLGFAFDQNLKNDNLFVIFSQFTGVPSQWHWGGTASLPLQVYEPPSARSNVPKSLFERNRSDGWGGGGGRMGGVGGWKERGGGW